MAFKPLSDLFENEKTQWQEADVKHFIQEYLRRATGSEAVYCQAISDGLVTVRVGSPALHQAVHVLEYDLAQELTKVAEYDLKRLKIVS